ncbi:ketopantoate reductase family protein [Paenibacillus antarcticus]|uniref:2-dehydropantoate 2-reductase n=1 Tax=Paenibacillus antarcticus TaxID=253703 RepID=A0A168LBM6_9BACL|nr:2-dehydropantoate 2-reductase [Paenibacillus antarcticus]OAB43151.1 hypothetical protein PBAT_19365 [Paenibacillus antarcticus]
MRIDIIGGGSLGLLYGGKLAFAGNEVRIWCRSMDQVLSLRTEGLHMTSVENLDASSVGPIRIEADVMDHFTEGWKRDPAEWIFLMTKQKDVEYIGSQLLAKIDKSTLKATHGMICYQNGTGHIELLNSLLPQWHIYSAITTEGAKRLSYNEVFHAGRGETNFGQVIDEQFQKENKNRRESENSLLYELRKAGFTSDLSNKIVNQIYRKLLINACINPLTALWRIHNGELMATQARVDMMRKLFLEGTAVYNASGIYWDDNLWDQIMSICVSTSANTSSMLQDILEDNPTEVKWINGSIVTLAEKKGLVATYHKSMVELIQGMSTKEG